MDLPDKTAPQQPQKKVTQVAAGVKEVNRPATKRFMHSVFAENPGELSKQVGRNVIIPRLKAGLEEAFNSFLSGMLWGDGASRPISTMVKGTVLRGGGVNYQGISSQPSGLQMAQAASRPEAGPYKDLVCPSQQIAETLLANMYDLMNQYRVVSVADLREMAGITPATSDNAYGWHSLDNARISKVRDGYLLEMPRPSLI